MKPGGPPEHAHASPVNLAEKLAVFSDHWKPRTVLSRQLQIRLRDRTVILGLRSIQFRRLWALIAGSGAADKAEVERDQEQDELCNGHLKSRLTADRP
jgi:hypothetical protein